MTPPKTPIPLCLATLLLCLTPVSVLGAEWFIQGNASETVLYDDNLRLSTDDPEAGFGFISTIGVDTGVQTGNLHAILSGTADFTRYPDNSESDADDYRVHFDGAHQTPLGEFRLGAAFSSQSTLTTQLVEDFDFSENATQTTVSVDPSWSYDLTSRDRINIYGGWTDTSFDSMTFSNSWSYTLGGGWTHQLTEVDEVSTTLSMRHVESDSEMDMVTISDVYGIAFGWTHTSSDRLSFDVTVGPRLVSTKSMGVEETVRAGGFLDSSMQYALDDRTTLSYTASSAVEPTTTGDGGVEERQRVSVGITHRLAPRTSASLDASYQRNGNLFFSNDDSDSGDDADEQQFFSVSPSITHQLSRYWDLSATYRFRAEQTGDAGDLAIGNSFLVTLSYRLSKRDLGHW